ncbi:MAG TPA: hypothetical protein VM120_02545 [Bryobacteraceae bacterium]|nr:hypothetical protein [Bryobacteraceae bacterium]
MYSVLLTMVASLAATGCSILLLRRGPTPRLRLLALTVGLMSLCQSASLLHSQGVWAIGWPVAQSHQALAASLSFVAIYILGAEIYDRNQTDRKLRLAEYEIARPVGEVAVPLVSAVAVRPLELPRVPALMTSPQAGVKGFAVSHDREKPALSESGSELHQASIRATAEILLLLSAVSAGPGAARTGETVAMAHETAAQLPFPEGVR